MQQQPILVDTVTSAWDIVGTMANALAGLGAVGALLIAALAYRRQVEDARAAQASKVVLYFQGNDVIIENCSPTPIYDVQLYFQLPAGRIELGLYEQCLGYGNSRKTYSGAPSPLDFPGMKVWMTFVDSSGHGW